MKRRADEILKWVNGPDVLDIGCTDHHVRSGSVYWFHGHLVEKYPDSFGIDINAGNVHAMEKDGFKNLSVQNAETFSLPCRFDTIIAGELIEHLTNPGLFLVQARLHLKSKGHLILTTPYPFSLLYNLYAFRKYPRTCQNDQHAMWFCPRTLHALAERCGFKVFHMGLIPDYELDNGSFSYVAFVRALIALRWFLPGRLWKNDLLCVLEPEEKLGVTGE